MKLSDLLHVTKKEQFMLIYDDEDLLYPIDCGKSWRLQERSDCLDKDVLMIKACKAGDDFLPSLLVLVEV